MARMLGGAVLAVACLTSCSAGPTTDLPTASFVVDLEPGETRFVGINGHCGFEWLSAKVNDQTWRAVGDWPRGGTVIEFELELLDDETLLIRVPGEAATHRYRPEEGRPLCE